MIKVRKAKCLNDVLKEYKRNNSIYYFKTLICLDGESRKEVFKKTEKANLYFNQRKLLSNQR